MCAAMACQAGRRAAGQACTRGSLMPSRTPHLPNSVCTPPAAAARGAAAPRPRRHPRAACGLQQEREAWVRAGMTWRAAPGGTRASARLSPSGLGSGFGCGWLRSAGVHGNRRLGSRFLVGSGLSCSRGEDPRGDQHGFPPLSRNIQVANSARPIS